MASLISRFAAELSADERVEALRLFELHMAVVEDLSKQHAAEVVSWSRTPRAATTLSDGKISSVYQHDTTKGTVVCTLTVIWS